MKRIYRLADEDTYDFTGDTIGIGFITFFNRQKINITKTPNRIRV